MSNTIDLTLDGLSCGHCVKRVKESLEQRPDVEQAEVTLTEAHVTGSASAQALIDTVKQAGYGAELSHPKAKPLAESSIPSEALTAATPELPAAHDEDDSQQLLINGMSCASCVSRVQNALAAVPGVSQARVNLAERTALVMGSASAAELVQAVEKAGYGAEAIEDDLQRRERQQETALATMKRFRWQAIVALLVGVPVMVWGMIGDNMMVSDDNRSLWLVIGLVTLAVMVFAGGHFYRSAWKSLKNGTATMDTLVALGTGVAWLYSMSVNLWPQWFPMEARHLYYEASAMIIGLINLGHMLEARARQRSSKALEKLLDLTPPSARVVTPEGEKDLPLAEVQAGMTLRLTTGDRVPVDGMISQGEAWFDEAMLTGEPVPQQKGDGDAIHAGTVVQDGSVLFTASAVGSQTTLARIIRMVRQAQSSKPEIGQLAESFNRMKHSMAQQVSTLQEKNEIERELHRQKTEALELQNRMERSRLQQLRSQIDPHFLFNTLNVIQQMAGTESAYRTQALIMALSHLLRYSLMSNDEQVPLSREVRVVDEYYSIYHVRFGDRVQMEWAFSDSLDLTETMVPSFILQPIVENAFKHGICPKEEGGVVRIRMIPLREKGLLCIRVLDNGVGIEPEQLEQLRTALEQPAPRWEHIGIYNVAARLRLLDARCRVVVRSRPGRGTAVILYLPLVENEEEFEE